MLRRRLRRRRSRCPVAARRPREDAVRRADPARRRGAALALAATGSLRLRPLAWSDVGPCRDDSGGKPRRAAFSSTPSLRASSSPRRPVATIRDARLDRRRARRRHRRRDRRGDGRLGRDRRAHRRRRRRPRRRGDRASRALLNQSHLRTAAPARLGRGWRRASVPARVRRREAGAPALPGACHSGSCGGRFPPPPCRGHQASPFGPRSRAARRRVPAPRAGALGPRHLRPVAAHRRLPRARGRPPHVRPDILPLGSCGPAQGPPRGAPGGLGLRDRPLLRRRAPAGRRAREENASRTLRLGT